MFQISRENHPLGPGKGGATGKVFRSGYGIEEPVKKTEWIGEFLPGMPVNFGKKFLARYDRRHDISSVGIYTFSDRLTLSGTWVYGTGNNYSLPIRTFRTIPDVLGHDFNFIENRFEDIETQNNFRAEAYHRLDLSIRMSKKKRRGVRTWELSAYNVYNHKNPFFYFRDTKEVNNRTEGILKKATIFPILPSISYTYEF